MSTINKFPKIVIESIHDTHHLLKCKIIDHKEYTSNVYQQYTECMNEQNDLIKSLEELEEFIKENKDNL
jgi:hypothetical protein